MLQATPHFDYHHPKVRQLAQGIRGETHKQKAIDIYHTVRDGFIYNPYLIMDGEPSFSASYCAEKQQGYCLPKASLMIALCRAHGIPAKIGLADVKNHLSSDKLTALLRSDVFSMHAYVDLYLDDKWVKATPAFNLSLCEKFGLKPLEFDGTRDSIFHPYTQGGDKHMEYLADYGSFEALPVDFIFEHFSKHYPHLIPQLGIAVQGQALEDEV